MYCRFCRFPFLSEVHVDVGNTLRIYRVPCTHCGAIFERIEYVVGEPDPEKRKNVNT